MMSETNSYSISCMNFLEAIEAAGYDYCAASLKHRTDLMCLARAISCTQTQTLLSMPEHSSAKGQSSMKTEKGLINFKQFMQDIKEKPFKWWQHKLMTFL